MSKVTYTGSSDFQIFTSADFKKGGVDDQNKVTFTRGEPTEVSDAAAAALTGEEGVFGPYLFEASDESETADTGFGDEADPNPQVGDAPATSGEAATTEGTTSSATTAGTRSTGRGSSTRTS